MTVLLVLLGSISRKSMTGPPFSLQAHLTTVLCGATQRDIELPNPTCSESPDFLVQYRGQRVGIEVTQFSPVAGTSERRAEEQDNLRKRVMERARRLYQEAGGLPLCVEALFARSKFLSKARIPTLASELTTLLLEQCQNLAMYQQFPLSLQAQ